MELVTEGSECWIMVEPFRESDYYSLVPSLHPIRPVECSL